MTESLVINEIYLSLQGESTFAGLPCVFVRLTACNLRCSYCDTAYAFTEGRKMLVSEVRQEVLRLAEPFDQTAHKPVPKTKLEQSSKAPFPLTPALSPGEREYGPLPLDHTSSEVCTTTIG